MTTHLQSQPPSTNVLPPRFHGLPQRPKIHSFPLPMQRKPTTICRNYVFWGSCRDWHCDRAHVPHHLMVDLFGYILERDDCPSELRSLRGRFTRPTPGLSREERMSDGICNQFLLRDGFCWRNGCPFAHIRHIQIYNSLLPFARSQPIGPDPEPKTSVVALVPEAEHPVVKLPEKPNYTTQRPSLDDNIPPLSLIDQPTSTEPDGLEPRQYSVLLPLSELIVRLPKSPEPQPNTAGSSSLERQEDSPSTLAHSPELSEESSTASSLDLHSFDNESTVTDGCDIEQQDKSTIHHTQDVSGEGSSKRALNANSTISESAVADGRRSSTPATTSPPSKPFKQRVCRDWKNGRCRYRNCKFLHARPVCSTQTQQDNTAVQQAPPAQAPHDPPPAAQRSTVPVSSSPRPTPHSTEVATTTTIIERDPAVIVASVRNDPSLPITPSPPHSRRKDPPNNPSFPADTHASRPHIPRKAEEQPPPPRHTPGGGITLPVMECTNVKFSDGFSIEKITTGFESLWFVIDDVHESVGRSEIERLAAPFGVVQDVRFRDEKQSDKSVSRTASVQMSSYREVIQAVNGLDGQDALGQSISCQLSLGKRRSNMLRDNFVRVSWPTPRKAGYAGYSTLEAAQKAVSKADGKTVRGCWITASIYQTIPIIDAYNVRFMGLPPWAGREFLDKFGPSKGTMLERPNYTASDFGENAVRKTLASFGKITSWAMTPPPYTDGNIVAWCQFDSPDVAAAACELNRVKQRSLSMERILVRRVLSTLDHVPCSIFKLVEQDLQRLQEDVWKHTRGAHLKILPHSQHEGEKIGLKLVAEDSKTLARLKVELKEILDGEILKEDGQKVWDDFFCRDAGSHFVDELRGHNPDVLIYVHAFRKCIRLVGAVERRKLVAAAILTELSSLRQHLIRSILLDRQTMGVLRSPDFAAAQQRYGEEGIRIDLQGHQILVCGPDSLYEEVQQIVQTVKSRHVTDDNDNCPVCLEPPMAPVSLRCGHKWCKSCFIAYLTAAAGTRSFPISCLGNQGMCTNLLPTNLARKILPPTDFDALTLAAFHAYVQARPGDYHYCPTPDCPQAYPTGPRNVPLSCPSCLARICPSCHVEYHEGITCEDREDGGDRLFQEWMRNHDVKKCPGCHAPIERAAGCNHMTCTRCHTHTCWVCLATFPQGQGIYDHMREFHGGIGL